MFYASLTIMFCVKFYRKLLELFFLKQTMSLIFFHTFDNLDTTINIAKQLNPQFFKPSGPYTTTIIT